MKNTVKLLLWLTTTVLIFPVGCDNKNVNQSDDSLVIVGSGACEEILKKLADAFNQKLSDFPVIVPKSIGSSGGVRAAGIGESIIARISRPIKEEEAGYGLEYLPFAKDPIVFAVGSGVDIKSITTEQIIKIYSGEITNWKQLGGPDSPVRVLGRETGETSRSEIEKCIPGFESAGHKDHIKTVYHDYEMVNMFEKYNSAFGYLTGSSLNENIHPLSIDGISPTIENVVSGKYPLIAEYAFVYKSGNLNKKAKQFLDFVFSKQGRTIMENNNIAPVSRN
ncbi:MAG: substrate-binding domain-containing protein [Phycisphaerae bacterium]